MGILELADIQDIGGKLEKNVIVTIPGIIEYTALGTCRSVIATGDWRMNTYKQ